MLAQEPKKTNGRRHILKRKENVPVFLHLFSLPSFVCVCLLRSGFEREKKRERNRERQTDRQTDRQTESQTETDRQTDRQTETEERQRQTETDRQRQRQTETDRQRETDRQTETETEGQVRFGFIDMTFTVLSTLFYIA